MNWRRASTLVLVSLLPPCIALAGTIRDDVPDASYLSLAAGYPSVGHIVVAYNNGDAFTGSGVLIADGWVLSAGHMFTYAPEGYFLADVNFNSNFTAFTFQNGFSVPYPDARKFSAVILEPGWAASGGDLSAGNDLSLIRLNALVTNAAPAVRYTGSSEVGNVGTIAGYGATGTGLTGYGNNAGTKRAGDNAIDALGTFYSFSANSILVDFDDPPGPPNSPNRFGSNDALPLEYLAAPGDSGGGIFIDVNGSPQLAGVTSFILDPSIFGSPDAAYGDVAGFTRVSPYNAWINSVLAAYADTMTWTAGSSNFNNPANWQGLSLANTVPGSLDHALFSAAGVHTVTFNSAITNKNLTVRDGDNTLHLAGFSYNLTATATIGDTNTGSTARLIVSNGSLSAPSVAVGDAPAATAELRLDNAAVNAANVTIGNAGTLAGVGAITADVANAGRVAPGNSTGALAVTGNYTQTADGALEIQLASAADFDTLAVTGSADLAGSLIVTLLGGYTPGPDDTFTVLTADAVTGSFSFDSPVFNHIFYFVPQYDPDAVTLAVLFALITGDANNDGVVDAADFLAVEANFGATGASDGLLAGDANDDGRVDGTDWLFVERHFGESLDLDGPAIPEPASGGIALLMLSVSLLSRAHRKTTPTK